MKMDRAIFNFDGTRGDRPPSIGTKFVDGDREFTVFKVQNMNRYTDGNQNVWYEVHCRVWDNGSVKLTPAGGRRKMQNEAS